MASSTTEQAKALFAYERSLQRLDGWFLAKEAQMLAEAQLKGLSSLERAAAETRIAVETLPLSIPEHAIFVGTQRDAFARSYALINPQFAVESFTGYCDPTAVFADIEPDEEITRERIEAVREYTRRSVYGRVLADAYAAVQEQTAEVAFFVEQVTGHVIPDVRPMLRHGVEYFRRLLAEKAGQEPDAEKQANWQSMREALACVLVLAERYRALASEEAQLAQGERRVRLLRMERTLAKIPARGAENLYEAIQMFMLLWQVMTLEQAPNPFAFSVGNADRIFEPYRAMEDLGREETAALFKHLLVFFNVGDRSWAISQNLMIGGRDGDGKDLTNETSYALLDAYHDMNLPQPILSVKLHRGTPQPLYEALGRFWFTPGCLTPSLFNDDALFAVLTQAGIQPADLPDYAVAGCQEPLIMGKDNGNTTNSWLNLAKILELTLNDGKSLLTGRAMGGALLKTVPALEKLQTIGKRFADNLDWYLQRMTTAANKATEAVSHLPVPFLSTMMGGLDSGWDMRDTKHQSTRYNGSGCLIHGLAVVADSLVAIEKLVKTRPEDAERLLKALQTNFEGDEALRQILLSCPKFGNNEPEPDTQAAELARHVAKKVRQQRNNWGNPFRPDFSTPSTHLLYGYWVGALPDGRKAREMLNYGVDPLHGEATNGLGFRTLSTMKLPFAVMCGGYASHMGVDPKYFRAPDHAGKGMEFLERIVAPLFFNATQAGVAPFYLYVNVTTPETLRKVLADPKKYAPSGVYIMRIHGTFVNFLDLSPAIQQDIIKRLDPASTAMEA